ncbi:MAG: type II toxin-antitoxin system RelB/DinJ family antitoxin [Clostridia bacterium]|nr:type II toxin-antitoxin system RelB/DinJ family antitoxin [Clostridia bacterium]
MAKVSTNITIDSDTKAKAHELFADFGLDLSTAINIFLRQAIRENAIPFPITRRTPPADTPTPQDAADSR